MTAKGPDVLDPDYIENLVDITRQAKQLVLEYDSEEDPTRGNYVQGYDEMHDLLESDGYNPFDRLEEELHREVTDPQALRYVGEDESLTVSEYLVLLSDLEPSEQLFAKHGMKDVSPLALERQVKDLSEYMEKVLGSTDSTGLDFSLDRKKARKGRDNIVEQIDALEQSLSELMRMV